MADGKIIAICISNVARGPMISVQHVEAIAGEGLAGDRYCTGNGSYSRGKIGNRQVTFMNERFLRFFNYTGFEYTDVRRNIITSDVELMYLIGKEFEIGDGVWFRGLKYCEPCHIPSKLSGKPDFQSTFQDCGGLIAEIIRGGIIKVDDRIIPPPKNYKPINQDTPVQQESVLVCPTCGNKDLFKVPNSDQYKCHVCTRDIIPNRP